VLSIASLFLPATSMVADLPRSALGRTKVPDLSCILQSVCLLDDGAFGNSKHSSHFSGRNLGVLFNQEDNSIGCFR